MTMAPVASERLLTALASWSYGVRQLVGALDAIGRPAHLPIVTRIVMSANQSNRNGGTLTMQGGPSPTARSEDWEERFLTADHAECADLLQSVADELEDVEYWKAVAITWQDSDRQHLGRREWQEFFSAERPHREAVMTNDQQAQFAALPERVTIYRGFNGRNRLHRAISWTLDREKAEWFARRVPPPEFSITLKAQVLRRRIVALFQERQESEVLVFPRYVDETEWLNVESRAAMDGAA